MSYSHKVKVHFAKLRTDYLYAEDREEGYNTDRPMAV